MQIHSNYPLQLLNSFGFAAFAQEFVSVKTNSELFDAISYANSKKLPWQIIGGGSNIVLRSNLPGLTIQMQILGKKLVRETESQFVIDVGAGENWHDFVLWTIDQNFGGLALFLGAAMGSYFSWSNSLITWAFVVIYALILGVGWFTLVKAHQKYLQRRIFYFILYICAFEIAPWIILWRYLNKGLL